jgi:uncharacterized membrane protein
MRIRSLAVALLVSVGVTVMASSAHAQAIGVYAGYDSESEEGLVGINGHIPITIGKVPKTTISPQVEVLTNTDILVINAGASIRFHPWYKENAGISPYFGAGLLLGYDDYTEETNFAGQAIAGLEFPMGKVSPFTHVEFAFGDFDIVAFVGGIQLNF